MKAACVLTAATALTAALASCSSPAQGEKSVDTAFDGSGVVSAPMNLGMTYYVQGAPKDLVEGGKCHIDSPYRDLKAGSQLVVRSSDGKILATAELAEATLSGKRCDLTFALSDIPQQEDDIYEVAVGRGSRGTVIFTQADLSSGEARLSVS